MYTDRDIARAILSLIMLVVWDMKAVPVRLRQASDLYSTQSASGSRTLWEHGTCATGSISVMFQEKEIKIVVLLRQ